MDTLRRFSRFKLIRRSSTVYVTLLTAVSASLLSFMGILSEEYLVAGVLGAVLCVAMFAFAWMRYGLLIEAVQFGRPVWGLCVYALSDHRLKETTIQYRVPDGDIRRVIYFGVPKSRGVIVLVGSTGHAVVADSVCSADTIAGLEQELESAGKPRPEDLPQDEWEAAAAAALEAGF